MSVIAKDWVWFEHPETNEYIEFEVEFEYDFGQYASYDSPSTADQVYIVKVHCDNIPEWITEEMIYEKTTDIAVDYVNSMYD
jgi:hypothetical protein